MVDFYRGYFVVAYFDFDIVSVAVSITDVINLPIWCPKYNFFCRASRNHIT